MKWKRILRHSVIVPVAVMMTYAASYAVLRLTHTLVTRNYLVLLHDASGHETVVEHFDVGRGAAYGQQHQPRFTSFLGSVFRPLAAAELRLRGITGFPFAWPPELPMRESAEANQMPQDTAHKLADPEH